MKAKCESTEVAKTARGKKHFHAGFTLNHSIKGQVFIDMKDHVDDVIKEFKDEIIPEIENPADDELFKVCDSKLLTEEKKKEFCIMMAKALFLTKRARSNIEYVIAFSSTRAFKLNERD